jgi:hypothetical protein
MFGRVGSGGEGQLVDERLVGKRVLDAPRAAQVRAAEGRLLDVTGVDLHVGQRVADARVLEQEPDPVARLGQPPVLLAASSGKSSGLNATHGD